MKLKYLNDKVSVSEQIAIEDLEELKRLHVSIVICNRPDDEEPDQIRFDEIEAAAHLLRMKAIHMPFKGDEMSVDDINDLLCILKTYERIHLYCRSGARSSTLWALAGMRVGYHESTILDNVNDAGYKLDAPSLNKLLATKLGVNSGHDGVDCFDVVIVGGGSGGLSACASLRKRNKEISIAIIEPSDTIYYQPGWTMVGGGVFHVSSTKKRIKNFIPKSARWIQYSVKSFSPNKNAIMLEDDTVIRYRQLIVSAGLELNWSAIEGLEETLGKNAVTSNYRYDLAPYTWQLVQQTKAGKAIFTQPPMPIKCAGAPQKAMYLSSDYWYDNDLTSKVNVQFFSSGEGIFGVKDYVPALNSYLKKYQITTNFQHTLFKVDGDKQIAYFKTTDTDGLEQIVQSNFDMLHVCPPQRAPEFIRSSTLADAAGWLDVDQATLVHKSFANIWGIGDVTNTPNAKTLAAVRKQVPVVAQNLIATLKGARPTAVYSGYGSCPLTVERGKIILAEFDYSGKHTPTFPNWLNDGIKPTRFAWFLKEKILPYVYWRQMLKGVEWFTKPKQIK